MDSSPVIYYVGGEFLVFNECHARLLRGHRIIGQLVGLSHQNTTSGLPCLISRYAVNIILRHNLGVFKKMQPRQGLVASQNESQYLEKLEELKEEARRDFVKKRSEELKKRKLEIKPERMGRFDEKKMRITLPSTIALDYSSFVDLVMEESEILSILEQLDNNKSIVFEDLYGNGYYVTTGMKFGSDFLAYAGDPLRYHAQYAIRVMKSLDSTSESYNEINAFHRLCHGASKTPLFAVVVSDGNKQVKYWTLKDREYLRPESNFSDFESISIKLNPI